jgi:hypothetical protein
MKFSKKQVQQRAANIRRAYKLGLLSPLEIKLYESLPRWEWAKQATITEWVLEAERLAEEHGVLPNDQWLRDNRYRGLQVSMQVHPEAYAHIKQDRKLKTVADWVSVAKRLAEEHEGVLPHSGWLQSHKLVGLQKCILSNPEAFKHIKRERRAAGSKVGTNLKAVDVTLAKTMKAQGASLRDIAKHLNVSVALVWRRLK